MTRISQIHQDLRQIKAVDTAIPVDIYIQLSHNRQRRQSGTCLRRQNRVRQIHEPVRISISCKRSVYSRFIRKHMIEHRTAKNCQCGKSDYTEQRNIERPEPGRFCMTE